MARGILNLASSKTKDYFDNSSLQGLRYITEPNRHFTERIFWCIACMSAMYGTYKLLMASWYNFQNNAVSFVVETSYLDWNTTFAAVSICENESPDKIYESGTKLFGADRNMNMDFYLRDIAFFDGTCYSCKTHCGKTLNCTKDLKYLVDSVRANCEQLIDMCKWNGEPFECCKRFLPLTTETGMCYTINSMQTEKVDKNMKLISNRVNGPGKLEFQVYESAKLFIHSRDDVPYINHPQQEKAVLNWGTIFTMSYQVNEIENDPLLSDVSVEQRSCRFPEENFLDTYKYYSYSACVVDCRTKAQVAFCNCTHHFMPKREGIKTCDIEGLACLTENSETLRALKTKDNEKKGLVCDCMSSCIEPEYTVVAKTQGSNEDYTEERYGSKVTVNMDALPSQRFKRNVVRTRLDLVVSMGGTAGLFIGASLLSIGELFVFMLLRHKLATRDNTVASTKPVKQPTTQMNKKSANHPIFANPYIRTPSNTHQLHYRNYNRKNEFHYLS